MWDRHNLFMMNSPQESIANVIGVLMFPVTLDDSLNVVTFVVVVEGSLVGFVVVVPSVLKTLSVVLLVSP